MLTMVLLSLLRMPFSRKASQIARTFANIMMPCHDCLPKRRGCSRSFCWYSCCDQTTGQLLEVSLYPGWPGSNSNSPSICEFGSFASCVPNQFNSLESFGMIRHEKLLMLQKVVVQYLCCSSVMLGYGEYKNYMYIYIFIIYKFILSFHTRLCHTQQEPLSIHVFIHPSISQIYPSIYCWTLICSDIISDSHPRTPEPVNHNSG